MNEKFFDFLRSHDVFNFYRDELMKKDYNTFNSYADANPPDKWIKRFIIWDQTPQGWEFWNQLNKKWINILKEKEMNRLECDCGCDEFEIRLYLDLSNGYLSYDDVTEVVCLDCGDLIEVPDDYKFPKLPRVEIKSAVKHHSTKDDIEQLLT